MGVLDDVSPLAHRVLSRVLGWGVVCGRSPSTSIPAKSEAKTAMGAASTSGEVVSRIAPRKGAA